MKQLKYNTRNVDDRYDRISEIGYNDYYQYPVTDEPFNMSNFQKFRWDKNIQAWVEGEIDEDGNWELKEKK